MSTAVSATARPANRLSAIRAIVLLGAVLGFGLGQVFGHPPSRVPSAARQARMAISHVGSAVGTLASAPVVAHSWAEPWTVVPPTSVTQPTATPTPTPAPKPHHPPKGKGNKHHGDNSPSLAGTFLAWTAWLPPGHLKWPGKHLGWLNNLAHWHF